MNNRQLFKYKIGLLVIGLFTLALLVMVLVQASAAKQDTQTDKLANSMADSLNNYTDTNAAVPATLSQAGIRKTSPYISYARLSSSKYKFCVTYKAASSNFDPSTAVDNVLAGGLAAGGSGLDAGTNVYLSIPASHHKGLNCQTVDISGGFGSGGCDNNTFTNSATLESVVRNSGILCPLGSGGTSDSNLSAGDSQRETDIDALDAHLEAYYALNGYYPTLAELNDASWRSTNMQGLDASVVCDPSASSTANCQFASAPQKSAYSYEVLDGSGQNCTSDQDCMSFTLTATLSTGGQFTKQSNV